VKKSTNAGKTQQTEKMSSGNPHKSDILSKRGRKRIDPARSKIELVKQPLIAGTENRQELEKIRKKRG